MGYTIGNWTPSTLNTLEWLSQCNAEGKRPHWSQVKSGTYKNWLAVLRKEGYVDYSDGFRLLEKGKQLLLSLNKMPPPDRRKTTTHPSAEKWSNKKIPQGGWITIRGSTLQFQSTLSSNEEVALVLQAIAGVKLSNKNDEQPDNMYDMLKIENAELKAEFLLRVNETVEIVRVITEMIQRKK